MLILHNLVMTNAKILNCQCVMVVVTLVRETLFKSWSTEFSSEYKTNFTPFHDDHFHVTMTDAYVLISLPTYLYYDYDLYAMTVVGNCFYSGATLRRPHLAEGRAFL